MILVMVGTHDDPFDRLVRAAEAMASLTEDRIVVQRGTSAVEPRGCESFAFCTPRHLEAWVREAGVVVTHAGPASVHLARRHGHVPIVVPRDPAHGEHVDGHQLAWVEHLAGRARVLRDPLGLADVVFAHHDWVREHPMTGQAVEADTEQFGIRLGRLVDELGEQPRWGGRRRVSTGVLRSWLRVSRR